MDYALGLIETKGLVAAIEAADAMVKASNVKIIGKEKVTGALIIIKVVGETAAVKASVDAGSAAAQRVGELVSAHVIPRPDDQVDSILFDRKWNEDKKEKTPTNKATPSNTPKVKPQEIKSNTVVKDKKKKLATKAKPKVQEIVSKTKTATVGSPKEKYPPMDQLIILNVHALRRIARGFEDFPIKGREISKANRAKLLDYFKSLQ